MHNYSPNMLKTFEQCQRKFQLKYIERLSLPQESKMFEKGKKIHALASYFLKNENIEKFEKSLSKEELELWQKLKKVKYLNFTPVETEYNISSKVDKYWVGGRLDALVKNEEDYFILDYKTGQIPKDAKLDFQTIVYLLGIEKLLAKKELNKKSLSFVYIGLKNNDEQIITLSKELQNIYEEKILSICNKIDLATDSNNFSKNTTICKSCEYNKICNI